MISVPSKIMAGPLLSKEIAFKASLDYPADRLSYRLRALTKYRHQKNSNKKFTGYLKKFIDLVF